MSRNFIAEDHIEKGVLDILEKTPFNYDAIIVCNPSLDKKEDLNDGTGRTSKKQCVLPNVLKESLEKLNPNLSKEIIDKEYNYLCQDFSNKDLKDINYRLYKKLTGRDNKVDILKNGKEDFDFIKLIDFENPLNNNFTAVSQMWIKGTYNWRRTDVLIFVNGLPLVFIEYKNAIKKVKEAYDKNLKSYLKDIPNLFAFNQICVLSNGLETRMGAFSSTYDYFFEWLRDDEKDVVYRDDIILEKSSIKYFVNSLLKKEKLLDYIENFILYDKKNTKIIAQNHQYLGVNNLIKSFENRDKLKGKLGVFWHTQGSGKSYSMVMFARKVKRKYKGDFTFLIITDRDELDTQIHKTFLRTETIGKDDETQPKNSEQLRDFLSKDKEFVFTLIHKFRYDKNKKYPLLTERNDIIVLVDEAHRTEYSDLADNMRLALPNANFVAFTGTPLLGSKRLTNQWFGDYVSEYNFARSVEDGATVPLYYEQHVCTAELENDYLDDDILDILDNLNEEEQAKVENSESKVLEVIKRNDILEDVAKHIASHFPRRGYLGKAMVVAVDKYTAVRLYDKVKRYLEEEKKKLVEERNSEKDKEKVEDLTKRINYLNETEMAVVISEDADEIEKFKKQGLEIASHRERMNFVDPDGNDIEDQFQDPNNKLRLVFVCSMWLTGFDVKNLSTLYLDKPMKAHTLMQAIARANRVYEGKACGLIIDYVNVFNYMKKALSDYATSNVEGSMPVKDVDLLIENLDDTIKQTLKFFKENKIDIEVVLNEKDKMKQLDLIRDIYNKIVEKEDTKNRFKVLSNTMLKLYDASRPEIYDYDWDDEKFKPIKYINGLLYNLIDDEKVNNARLEIQKVLDNSVSVTGIKDDKKAVIKEGKLIDLSKLDTSEIKKRINKTPYKALEIEEIRIFIEEALVQLIDKNQGRIKFSERYRRIIDRYNAGSTENNEYYEELLKLIEELKQEQERPLTLGLTDEELEIYDLLMQEDVKLTKEDEQRVILASKNLYLKLKQEKDNLFMVDWQKDEQPINRVKSAIMDSLNNDLPEAFGKAVFEDVINLIMTFLIDKAEQGLIYV